MGGGKSKAKKPEGPKEIVQGQVSFPIGDWYLDPTEKAAGGVEAFVDDLHNTLVNQLSRATSKPAPGIRQLPRAGYGGELQILEDHRSSTLVYSDLTDSSRFTCVNGPKPGERPVTNEHPVLQFKAPQHRVRVHLEDMAAGPGGRVLWDAVYDLGGTETLKYAAKPLGGLRPNMELLCPPLVGPPHWYVLRASAEPVPVPPPPPPRRRRQKPQKPQSGAIASEFIGEGTASQPMKGVRCQLLRMAGEVGLKVPDAERMKKAFCPPPPEPRPLSLPAPRRRPLEDFIGEQLLTTYRPDQDPQQLGLEESGAFAYDARTRCAVM